jgi:hypothetical protein
LITQRAVVCRACHGDGTVTRFTENTGRNLSPGYFFFCWSARVSSPTGHHVSSLSLPK